MTQAEKIEDMKLSGKVDKKATAQLNLRKSFVELNPVEQQAVTHFFNAHNIASFLYESLSKKGQKYVKTCISLSQEKVDEE